MNLDFSDEQKQLREQVRRFLSEKCTPAHVRVILEGPETYDKALYKGLADLSAGWYYTESSRKRIRRKSSILRIGLAALLYLSSAAGRQTFNPEYTPELQ